MVEFAFVFPIFFFIVYSLIGYGLLFMLEQSITLAAEEGARAAIAVDPNEFADTSAYETAAVARAREVVRDQLGWLPEHQRGFLDDEGNVSAVVGADKVITVTVTYPDYENNPIIPALSLPGFASVPPYPADIKAEANIQL